MPRKVQMHYQDPLDAIWLRAAERMHLKIERSDATYASTDGKGTLFLAHEQELDADDCTAQMILHELCHYLVQGLESVAWLDWGLSNDTPADGSGEDDYLEFACLRLQAKLLDEYGLRKVFAPTTDFRDFYDALPLDPFEERAPEERTSICIARGALARMRLKPFHPHLSDALRTTAELVQLTQRFLEAEAKPREESQQAASTLLFGSAHTPPARHLIGRPMSQLEAVCGDCAWFSPLEGCSTGGRCRRAEEVELNDALPACDGFEPTFDCLGCGACCREAYDTVEVDREDPAYALHLPLLQPGWGGGFDMQRRGHRCIALQGGEEIAVRRSALEPEKQPERPPLPLTIPNDVPFTCAIYETRPQTCRDFTLGSEHCLDARRRVGLSI